MVSDENKKKPFAFTLFLLISCYGESYFIFWFIALRMFSLTLCRFSSIDFLQVLMTFFGFSSTFYKLLSTFSMFSLTFSMFSRLSPGSRLLQVLDFLRFSTSQGFKLLKGFQLLKVLEFLAS